jgi:hypothetical protein
MSAGIEQPTEAVEAMTTQREIQIHIDQMFEQTGADIPMGTMARHLRVRKKQIEALGDYFDGRDVPLADLTADVPCGDCNACCHIPVELLPRESGEGLDFELVRDGVRRLRRNPDGSCIHLVAGRCSVHDHRPVLCRRYDCRDYVVCGLEPSDQPLVAKQVRRWRPQFKSDADRDAYAKTRVIGHPLALDEMVITDGTFFTAIKLHDKSDAEVDLILAMRRAISATTNSTPGDQTP